MKNKGFLIEFIGTFCLVFFGTGSVIISEEYEIFGALEIGIVFGLSVFGLIYIFGRYSECHINPAVTLTFFKKEPELHKKWLLYIISQFLGAIAASVILKVLFFQNINLGNTLPSGAWYESFLLEFVLSFILMGVILFTIYTQKKLFISALLIGFTVFLEAWLAGPICGASMNPARTLGPSLVSGNLTYLWIYLTAPVLGMIAVDIIGKLFLNNSKS